MPNTLKKRIIKLKTNILRARFNLMFMVILSAVNLITIHSGNNILMPFSSAISTYSAFFGKQLSVEQGSNLFSFMGLLIATVILGILLLCYFKSKTKPFFFVASLGIVVIDTLTLLIFSLSGYAYSPTLFFVDVLVHIMTVIYLISALKSDKELANIGIRTDEETTKEEIDELEEKQDEELSFIDKYIEDDGEILLSGEYNEYDVYVVAKDNRVSLIINEHIYDSLEFVHTSEFELKAVVEGVEFIFDYKRKYSGETMYLYASGVLLDSFAKDFL